MIIEIRERKFDIELANNWCREKYQDMLELIDDLSAIPDDIEELSEGADDKTKDEQREIIKQIRSKSKEQRQLVKEISFIRSEIVRELLESNEIEYDGRFWSKKCDVDDLNDFMLVALGKDVKDRKGSKKK